MKPIDMHVHMVGNGSSGSGCWIRPQGWRRALAAFMLRHIGLPANALKGDLDRLYVERLLELVRGSSLGAIVILAQEQAYDEEGHLMENQGLFYVPNDYVLKLAKKHPEFLPAVSIHPARPDALEELERCIQEGAVMMKCLPNCQNIDCNNKRYTKFWERMAEAKLPLLAHTGGEEVVPEIRPEFADPRNLELPLQCAVTVIAAHCGSKSFLFDPDYFDIFVEMTRKYPNFYGDTSAMNMPIRCRHLAACLEEPLIHHMVHGSDFPVPVLGHGLWFSNQMDWQVFRKWGKHPNPIERAYQFKRAVGFSEESFMWVNKLLRIPSQKFHTELTGSTEK